MLYNANMVSKAQIRATTKYESNNIDKITLRLRRDGGYGITREDIQKASAQAGESVNEFVINAIKERIQNF